MKRQEAPDRDPVGGLPVDPAGRRRMLPSVQSLRVFEAVARLHGVGLAARELQVTPGAASRQLERLEAGLGTALTVPGSRPIALSKEGLAYLWPVQTFLAAIRLAGPGRRPQPFFPSLRAMLAIESAARSLSFNAAAAALFLTPSAVSQQVRLLESQLGWKVFIRLNQGLLLTDRGHRLLVRFQRALDALEAGTAAIMSRTASRRSLNICTLSTFATEWLIPKLRDFARQHPDIELSFQTGTGEVDFEKAAQVDAFISYGPGSWPGLAADALARDPMVIVAAPDLVRKGCESPAEIAAMPLLHHSLMPQAWRDWFDAAGVHCPTGGPSYRFEQFGMLVQAAVAGLGFALVPRAFAQRYIDAGTLAICGRQGPGHHYSYWLVFPESRRTHAAFAAFRCWLLGLDAPADVSTCS